MINVHAVSYAPWLFSCGALLLVLAILLDLCSTPPRRPVQRPVTPASQFNDARACS
jgi:hypothetical protein